MPPVPPVELAPAFVPAAFGPPPLNIPIESPPSADTILAASFSSASLLSCVVAGA